MQRVPVDLPHRAPVGPHLRRQARRQRDLREPFQNLLTIPVVDRIVVEDHLDVGKTGQRKGAQMLHVRNAGHLDFNGYRDLLLHLFGRAPRPLRNHLDVVVGHVRISFDRQIVKRDGAPDE